MFRPLVIAVAALVVLGGCARKESDAAAANPHAVNTAAAGAAGASPERKAGQPNDIFSAAPVQAQQAPARNIGKVVQSQNGGGYTYAEVETAAGQKVWIAGSQIDAKPGTQVQWGNFALMRNFEAKSLGGRTFPEILFVDRWGPVGQAAKAVAPHGSFPSPQAAEAGAGPAAGGTVRSVTNAGGYSYIEVEQGGQTVWVAATETPVKKGDKVEWQGASQMSNFTARSIGRTFDKILFVQSVAVK